MMLVATLACWLLPPALLIGLLVLSLKRPRWAAPTVNALASGIAAAAMVFVFFSIAGVMLHGPYADQAKPGWAWKVPVFASYVSAFALAAGWASTTLYLAGRETLRGQWGGPRCPQPMTISLAFVLLLGLTAFYVDHARGVAEIITDPADPADALTPSTDLSDSDSGGTPVHHSPPATDADQ